LCKYEVSVLQVVYLLLPVSHIIVCSGDIADLIFVFFDPIGQALCKRTLSLVEQLNDKHVERMRFYLSKADEAGHEADRQVAYLQ